MTDAEVFSSRMRQWSDYLASPWARVRYAVVAHVLDEMIWSLSLDRAVHVLDLGGGDGVDSVRLAAAGHQVTIVDTSATMLDRARAAAAAVNAGERLTTVDSALLTWRPDRAYDLVLCHFVLQYLDDDGPALDVLASTAAAGGVVSIVCPNPPADVLSALQRDGDVALATRRLHGEPVRSATFDHQLRSVPWQSVAERLGHRGFAVSRRLGLRAAVDLLPDGPAKTDPGAYDSILALELELAERDPYRDVARAWQLLARAPTRSDGSRDQK